MYFKKLLLLVSLIGLLILGFISYNIYGIIFSPNTNFEQSHVLIRINEKDTFDTMYTTVAPFLVNPDSFKTMARKRALQKYAKPGVYRIEKGMSNNEIIDVITKRKP